MGKQQESTGKRIERVNPIAATAPAVAANGGMNDTSLKTNERGTVV